MASASFIGTWVFHSIMNTEQNGAGKFLSAEELLKHIPDNIDKNDAKAWEECEVANGLLTLVMVRYQKVN